jgi:hypothetical protein
MVVHFLKGELTPGFDQCIISNDRQISEDDDFPAESMFSTSLLRSLD